MSDPLDHHYIPVFYLTRWVGADGRLCRFSRPVGTIVKTKRVVPKGTGFEPRLYTTQGLPLDQAQTMEKDFMAKLDTQASEALVMLETGLPDGQWTRGPRSAWSRFLLAQRLRAPEDIAQLKSSVTEDWSVADSRIAEAYEAGRSEAFPATVGEYLKSQSPGDTDAAAFKVARTLMDHPRIGGMINNMHWSVLDFPTEAEPLLTSDRPVWITATLIEQGAMIVMPIGPRRLFVAAPDPTTLERVNAQSRAELAHGWNRVTAQHAVRYVYGVDAALLPMVQEHFATRRHSSLLELIAADRNHKVVAPDSPAAKSTAKN